MSSFRDFEGRIIASRNSYFACIRKFVEQKNQQGDDFVPDDLCIERVNAYWTRISALCNSEGCENSKDRYVWEGQYKFFTSLLGHLKDKEFFDQRLFDEDVVFGRK